MKALILVDLQNDFAPGGALAVPRGDEVVAVANRVMPAFELVVATQDWHPADHGSFASNHPGRKVFETIELAGQPQTLWPDHCVQNTGGAMFIPGLDTRRITRVFPKGTDASIDSYSGFFDNGHRRATGLGDYFTLRGVNEVYVMGLATDYCVKATAIDARKLGLAVKVIVEGVRGVELKPGDCEGAMQAMRDAGVEVVSGASEEFRILRG